MNTLIDRINLQQHKHWTRKCKLPSCFAGGCDFSVCLFNYLLFCCYYLLFMSVSFVSFFHILCSLSVSRSETPFLYNWDYRTSMVTCWLLQYKHIHTRPAMDILKCMRKYSHFTYTASKVRAKMTQLKRQDCSKFPSILEPNWRGLMPLPSG